MPDTSVLHTIQFQISTDRKDAFTEDLFKKAAEAAFQQVNPSGIRLRNSMLQGILEEEEDNSTLVLSVRMDLDGIAVPLSTSLHASAQGRRPAADVVRQGLRDLEGAVRDLLHLAQASPERLTEALSSSEPDVQIFAASLVGEKKIVGAAEALCRMLNDPREEVAEAAADALKKVGTPTSVPLVIQSISKNNLRSEVRAIEVIASIGGKEAEAYLEMTAMGHEIPEVRALSESLLGTLKKKQRR